MSTDPYNINPDKIGKTIGETTNYLQKLSDYIENKLYDSDGNARQSGVKSLSLTFAMLVGFSVSILVVSTIFISFIVISKSKTIEEKEIEIKKYEFKLEKEEHSSDYWEKRYNNVYSQCDSIGYQRARQAWEFSHSLNNEISTQKEKVEKVIEKNSNEIKELKTINNEINQFKSQIK